MVEGSAEAQGSKVKPARRVKAAQNDQSKGQSDTKGGPQLEHLGPHRGDPTSSTFVSESRLRGFLHAPPYWLALSPLGFPTRDYPGKMLETT
jgi:hypothetical protein